MAAPIHDETEDKPLDPAAERVRRKLVRFMAINLGILFAAVMAVVAALVYQSMTAGSGDQVIMSPLDAVMHALPIPPGARVISHSISGDRLSLHVASSGEEAIVVYDMTTSRILYRFTIGEP